jgi:L-alanine-DL-glutamate epimerase-like enolase superfamily enzyme
MKINYKIKEFPFRHPFRISKGIKSVQRSLLVELEHFGYKGYGEAPQIAYYNITADQMAEDIERKRPFLEKFTFTDPERYWHYLHHLFPNNSFLVCALDMAGWDIFGKMKRMPLHQLWKLEASKAPMTDFTIGIDTPELMLTKIDEKPWPIYKIKVGFEGDMEVLEAIRKHTDAIIRVDANAAWDLDTALQKLKIMHELGVELVEQPLAKEDWDGMKILVANSPIPLFADESCVHERDVEACHGFFHGINIKLTKCSGITPARRMIEKARSLGMSVMLGSMNENAIGSAAIAHLAPLVDYVDNDGTLLQTSLAATSIRFEHGRMIYPESGGLGLSDVDF